MDTNWVEKEKNNLIQKIQNTANKLSRKIKLDDWTKAGSYAPHMWRYVFDIRVI